jgi:hypothetical protein
MVSEDSTSRDYLAVKGGPNLGPRQIPFSLMTSQAKSC